jgi:hypothetical protein
MIEKQNNHNDLNSNSGIPQLSQHLVAVALWNKKILPICPGLGKKRRTARPLVMAFLTSDSYGCLTPENA